MRFFRLACIASICWANWTTTSLAGLYYSGESYAEFPSQWRGFLLDHRLLRNIAQNPAVGKPINPTRARYLAEAERLAKKATPTADDQADLGALYLRLGQVEKAMDVLVPAQRQHPQHFHIAANLGTAWQLRGDLFRAVVSLEQAVRLAPDKLRPAETLHVKLVRERMRQGKSAPMIDDLFGVRFVNDKGDFEAGKLAADQKKKLPADALAQAQRLALWLPADGPLLWQLAELANAHGDVKSAAAMMEGCVTSFGMSGPEQRRRRHLVRAAADELAKGDVKAQHQESHGSLAFRSKKPLISRMDVNLLPPINPAGTNALPWELLSETILVRKARPMFHRYLQDLDGKEVTITGFMQPIGDGLEISSFMFVEHPIGCWFCESPDPTGIVHVELPAGKSMAVQRELLRVTGRFSVNATDPEDFLYSIRDARVGGID